MNKLPQELICQICGQLDQESLRQASYVSTRFRSAAEDCSGAHHYHSIDNATTAEFRQQYSGFRHRYIKRVEFKIHVPSADLQRQCQRELASEQHERDLMFSNQVRELFASLKHVEDRAGVRNIGAYELSIICDHRDTSGYICVHGDHAQWRTNLLDYDSLPILHSVRSLQIQNIEPGLKLDYRVLVDLTTHLPRLEAMTFHTGRDEWTPSYEEEPARSYLWEYDGPRRDTRRGFSEALAYYAVPWSLKQVKLDFLCEGSKNEWDEVHHWHSLPDLVNPAASDPFSTSLRILSYHLREFSLRAQVDKTLFWPQDNSTPTWPHLERLNIMFHMVAPSGQWYFEGPRGEGRNLRGHALDDGSYPSDEEDHGCKDDRDRSFENFTTFSFRVSPNMELMRPFLLDFASAAVNMPKLKEAILWAPLRWEPGGDDEYDCEAFDYFQPPHNETYGWEYAWGIAYCCPAEKSIFGIGDNRRICNTRRLWWQVGGWRPDESLAEAFRQIGREKYGDELGETYEHDETSQGLSDRYEFEEWDPPLKSVW
jgi:hypothetical protein